MLDYVNNKKNSRLGNHSVDYGDVIAEETTTLPRFMAPTIGRMNKVQEGVPQVEPIDIRKTLR